jgi:hypothetical protein
VGLDELQQLLLAWEERGEWPARLNPDLQTRVQPFRRLDGRPMGRLDWYAALIGEPGIIGASAHDPAHVERLQRLAIVLGEQIEQAMVGSGLRPIRDIDVFLSNYPDHDGRPFLRQVVLGDALFSPDKLHLCLPAIAFALRETTGDQSWSVDRLLDIVNGGSAGAKASPL